MVGKVADEEMWFDKSGGISRASVSDVAMLFSETGIRSQRSMKKLVRQRALPASARAPKYAQMRLRSWPPQGQRPMGCRGITQGSAAVSSRELESEAIKRSSEVDVYYLEGC